MVCRDHSEKTAGGDVEADHEISLFNGRCGSFWLIRLYELGYLYLTFQVLITGKTKRPVPRRLNYSFSRNVPCAILPIYIRPLKTPLDDCLRANSWGDLASEHVLSGLGNKPCVNKSAFDSISQRN